MDALRCLQWLLWLACLSVLDSHSLDSVGQELISRERHEHSHPSRGGHSRRLISGHGCGLRVSNTDKPTKPSLFTPSMPPHFLIFSTHSFLPYHIHTILGLRLWQKFIFSFATTVFGLKQLYYLFLNSMPWFNSFFPDLHVYKVTVNGIDYTCTPPSHRCTQCSAINYICPCETGSEPRM